ncbi:MAG: hypothetical protein AB7T06_23445 [Kofleriaceae bacterium]
MQELARRRCAPLAQVDNPHADAAAARPASNACEEIDRQLAEHTAHEAADAEARVMADVTYERALIVRAERTRVIDCTSKKISAGQDGPRW